MGKEAYFLTAFALIVLVSAAVYIVFKASTLGDPGYTIVDKSFAVLLLLAELFIFFHTIGFLTNILKSTGRYTTVSDRFFSQYKEPLVTCLICSYNEPREILEETIASVAAMDYRNKEIVLLDDSQGEARATAVRLAKKYKAKIIQRTDRKGYKAGAINAALPKLRGKYISIFDADQKPVANFLKDMVSMMEKDSKLALIQTPQFYANSAENPVAYAAEQRQSVFYEYVCEGKSTSNAMFCCGSNFLMRKDALGQAGGFDESTVTEDFATTLKLHQLGWRSLYYNAVYVSGLGPDTLGAYFTQQYRWAHGVTAVLKKVIAAFIRAPFSMRPGQWWEYFLSASYFLTGWTNFLMLSAPIAFLLFGVRPLIANPAAYVAAFVPYFVLSLVLFIYTMRQRGYTIRDLFIGQAIALITFDVYMVADLSAMLGLKVKFGVTPKGKSEILPLSVVWPQLTILLLSIAAFLVGLKRALATGDLAVWVNVFWVFYHAALFFYIFRFNRLFAKSEKPQIFAEAKAV